MSISSALQTGVSGLKANSQAVGKISENIANANTIGYKRGFSQFVTSSASGSSSSSVLSVSAVDVSKIDLAGGLLPTDSYTDLAISGDGFFVVSAGPNETLSTNYLLTRAGSFLADEDGNLVNKAGYYLAGYPYDLNGELGDVDRASFGDMETVNVSNISLSAAATTAVTISGNLPAQDTGLADPGSAFSSSTEYFTALGKSERLNFSWQPTSTENQWTVTVRDNEGAELGSVTIDYSDAGSLAGTPVSYSDVTSVAVAPAAFSFDTATGVATLTLDNGSTPQELTVSFGAPGSFGGLTQFAGDFNQSFDRDGSSVGELSRTEIDEDGTLYGVFDNGVRRALYQIPVGTVANVNGLKQSDGNAYELSKDAGNFMALEAGSGSLGTIASRSLEGSNVDIAEEMTDLIVAQRAFSTNAQIITTVDNMMETTAQLKR
ncbi:flagellar hook protein FlgE [Pseudodonghicola xiamenensis]|uniref:Flagellar hook protein FlgE n=1 Tax=Pseudodonghicola xiamenensis TaxID=337702 RepID=A0A8J3H703_9RHOB|nr:flagellar hook protein FlgE [Pseudodonghicola xiamenensis]GHG85479.1 flagellar hook protein FlgE [Pseudodonghicola xiamenensis]